MHTCMDAYMLKSRAYSFTALSTLILTSWNDRGELWKLSLRRVSNTSKGAETEGSFSNPNSLM